MTNRHDQQGFTIVELLIVIVVIGILAAITIVSFSGVSKRASIASMKSDLDNGAKQIKVYAAENSEYPNSIDCTSPFDDKSICVKTSSSSATLDYSVNNSASPATFTLVIRSSGIAYHINQDSTPLSGEPGWADNTSTWNRAGKPIVHTIADDPSGLNKGTALLIDFDNPAWDYNITIDNNGGKYHFENGLPYTMTAEVYGRGGHSCSASVLIQNLTGSTLFYDFLDNYSFTADGAWHTISQSITGFSGPTGDYYLSLWDQAGEGDWYIGSLTLTQQ